MTVLAISGPPAPGGKFQPSWHRSAASRLVYRSAGWSGRREGRARPRVGREGGKEQKSVKCEGAREAVTSQVLGGSRDQGRCVGERAMCPA